MGKVVERKGKKKKGRPSLLDLQKRNLKQHQQQQNHNQKITPDHKKSNLSSATNNYKNATPSPFRRSTRRSNPIIEADDEEEEEDEDDEEESGGTGRRKKREKKLELVLKLQDDEVSNSEGEEEDDDDEAEKSHKKRKINAIPGGSGTIDKKEEKPSVANNTVAETVDEDGTATALPNKKLLEFVLDRLQKKDTYGVFSEPVDPDELPDYREIIENPMDFGTVRQKLADGAYSSLEQFERDIFLICSNAMEYNAPDTIYFRQAKSIHELAKKNFENLRQDSDGNEVEPKVVRRGRPPKHLKKTMGRTSLEPSSDLPNDKTPPTAGETSTWSNYDLRKGIVLEKSGPPELAGRSFQGSRNSESYTGLSTEHKFERNDEFTGSRGKSYKYGKKQPALDEERRNTYMHLSAGAREPSVLAMFDGEKKMLLPVGLHSEHGYARSLARFAANLGPVAWKIASRKIEKSLPSGLMFGPGWVGEKEVETKRPVLLTPDPCSHPLRLQYHSPFGSPSTVNSEIDKLSDNMKGDVAYDRKFQSPPWSSDSRLNKFPSPSTTSASTPASVRCSEAAAERAETVNASDSNIRFNVLDSSNGIMGPRTPLQIQQSSIIRPGMNGINGAGGYDLKSQTSKLVGAIRPTSVNLHSPRMHNAVPRTNNNISGSCFNSGVPEHCENSASQGLSQHSKQAAVPPDLNVRFQTPGSPSSTRADSTQPDLALQL